jgi:hypothetical protein
MGRALDEKGAPSFNSAAGRVPPAERQDWNASFDQSGELGEERLSAKRLTPAQLEYLLHLMAHGMA